MFTQGPLVFIISFLNLGCPVVSEAALSPAVTSPTPKSLIFSSTSTSTSNPPSDPICAKSCGTHSHNSTNSPDEIQHPTNAPHALELRTAQTLPPRAVIVPIPKVAPKVPEYVAPPAAPAPPPRNPNRPGSAEPPKDRGDPPEAPEAPDLPDDSDDPLSQTPFSSRTTDFARFPTLFPTSTRVPRLFPTTTRFSTLFPTSTRFSTLFPTSTRTAIAPFAASSTSSAMSVSTGNAASRGSRTAVDDVVIIAASAVMVAIFLL